MAATAPASAVGTESTTAIGIDQLVPEQVAPDGCEAAPERRHGARARGVRDQTRGGPGACEERHDRAAEQDREQDRDQGREQGRAVGRLVTGARHAERLGAGRIVDQAQVPCAPADLEVRAGLPESALGAELALDPQRLLALTGDGAQSANQGAPRQTVHLEVRGMVRDHAHSVEEQHRAVVVVHDGGAGEHQLAQRAVLARGHLLEQRVRLQGGQPGGVRGREQEQPGHQRREDQDREGSDHGRRS